MNTLECSEDGSKKRQKKVILVILALGMCLWFILIGLAAYRHLNYQDEYKLQLQPYQSEELPFTSTVFFDQITVNSNTKADSTTTFLKSKPELSSNKKNFLFNQRLGFTEYDTISMRSFVLQENSTLQVTWIIQPGKFFYIKNI